jgi:hypothetical protein
MPHTSRRLTCTLLCTVVAAAGRGRELLEGAAFQQRTTAPAQHNLRRALPQAGEIAPTASSTANLQGTINCVVDTRKD